MNLSLEVGNVVINFDVEYRNRKTLAIRIDQTGKILVIAPSGLSTEVINEIVKSKSKWINRKLEEIKEVGYKPYERKFVDGELFMYLGKEFPLKIELDQDIKKVKVEINNGYLYVITFENNPMLLNNAVEKWYREECLNRVLKRVRYYGQALGKEPRKIRVKEQKKRWGTCTSRGDILLNWRCIMAPLNIIDYIVVHEMCHLIHMNHSKEFWKLVETILPDYRERKTWLKKYGVTLHM